MKISLSLRSIARASGPRTHRKGKKFLQHEKRLPRACLRCKTIKSFILSTPYFFDVESTLVRWCSRYHRQKKIWSGNQQCFIPALLQQGRQGLSGVQRRGVVTIVTRCELTARKSILSYVTGSCLRELCSVFLFESKICALYPWTDLI